MNLVVFGASGRTGILTVFQALDKGHTVTAFARNQKKVTIQHKNIRFVEGDILDYEKVKQAVSGQDAVISALGVESRKPTTVLSDGTRNILKAMEETGVKRFICMSSVGILGNDAGFWFGKIILPLFLRHVFDDKIRQMEIIKASKAEWVIVRPVGLTDSPKTNTYKVSLDNPKSSKIPRADVADFMLKLLTEKKYDGHIPSIYS
jgi:putative NADH-flavin reductase